MDSRFGHFPGISDWPLAVGQARQSGRAIFSAKGFEAAAVTAISMDLLAAALILPLPEYTVRVIKVVFDRPFGFLAVDRSSQLVLFAGWVETRRAIRTQRTTRGTIRCSGSAGPDLPPEAPSCSGA